MIYHLQGSLQDLPKNGDEWHWIRKGNMHDMAQCGDRFKKLLLVSHFILTFNNNKERNGQQSHASSNDEQLSLNRI